MSGQAWIVCERDRRWTPALRLALARRAAGRSAPLRLRETRHLSELAAELGERPGSFAALEVHAGNVGEILSWLAAAQRQFPHARFVALSDASLAADRRFRAVADALREAGAALVAESPRRLHDVLELAERHATVDRDRRAATQTDHLPLAELAWAALPWQDA